MAKYAKENVGKGAIFLPVGPIILASISGIYATVLRFALNLGFPRRVGETPCEYLLTLLPVKSRSFVDRGTEL